MTEPAHAPLPAQSAHPPGFGERLAQFADPLFGFAVARTGERELALDAVQEALTAAVAAETRGERWQTDENLWAWLTRVARNKLADEYRRRRVRAPTLAALDLDTDALASAVAAGGRLPADVLARSEGARLCRAALSELEPEARRIVEAFYRDGYAQQAIADRLGVSVKAVESRLARARKALRAVLQRWLDQPEDLL